MNLITIRYSSDPQRAQDFYTALGLTLNGSTSTDVWRDLRAKVGSVVIHPEFDNSPDWEFSLESTEPLENVQKRLADCHFEIGTIHSEEYGRYLMVDDPDGATIRINEIAS